MELFETKITEPTQKEFEAELINRFFDPKSYYLHSFISYLQKNDSLLEDPTQSVAIGLIVDDIISAANKVDKLSQLEKLGHFHFYNQQLYDGIHYLKESRLSTRQMMDIVGSLGRSLGETLAELLADDKARNDLFGMVGLTSNMGDQCFEAEDLPPDNLVKSQKIEVAEKIDQSNGSDELWSFFKNDINEKIDGLQQHLKRFEASNESKTLRLIKNDFKDLRDWSMIQGDQGIEAISHKILLLFETVYATDVQKASQVLPILKDAAETLSTINNAGRGSERLDIVRLVANQIDQQRKLFPQLSNHYQHPKDWQPDNEEIEVEKSEKPKNGQKGEPITEIEQEPQQTSDITTETELEPENISEQDTEIEPESGKESEQDDDIKFNFEDVIDQSFKEFDTEEKKSEEGQEDFESIRESELLSELISEHADDFVDTEEAEQEDAKSDENKESSGTEEPEDIDLPGEEDEELMKIIGELKTDEEIEENPEDMDTDWNQLTTDDFDATHFDQYIEKLEQEHENEAKETDQDKPIEQNSIQQDQPASPKMEEKRLDGTDFIVETEMYFSFARKALQQLMKSSSDKQALEDMELACYSLKLFADKLGYDFITRLMKYAERIVQKSLAQNTGLQTEQINALFAVIEEMEKAGKEKTLNTTDRLQWFQEQEEIFSTWCDSGNSSQPGKKSHPKEKQSEDPLDFLLFDDTSKFFKNLLND